jgi:ribosome-binding protein aMBF1 (putative translation factor)
MRSRALRSDHVGGFASEGTRLLWAAMHREGWSQNQLAAAVGADSGKVNRWLHATSRPSLRWALVLQAKLGIEPAAWEATPKKPIVLVASA